jgi:hypothetical protein
LRMFKSYSVTIILALLIGSIFDITKGLAFLGFFLGVDELFHAKEIYNKGRRKMGLAGLFVGIGACIFGVLAVTNII